MTALIEATDVRKSYGDKVVLADVSLSLEAHDVICLIGSSGSGKSTLLRCLNLLEDIDDGVIEFEGREISDPRVDRREVRSRMGMVFQAYNLFPHMTVLDNCTLAPRRVHGVPKQEAEERARDLLAPSASPTRPTSTRTGCPEASSSERRWCGRCARSRPCCSSTRSPRPSIPSWSVTC